MGEGFKGEENNNEKYKNRTRTKKISRNMDGGYSTMCSFINQIEPYADICMTTYVTINKQTKE
jgi:hypothetical protein